MNLGIATDVDNSNFAGSTKDPYAALWVEFYMNDQIIDQHKSQEQGKRVYKTVHIPDGEPEMVQIGANRFPVQRYKDTGERLKLPYVRIMVPGRNETLIDEPVREDHKAKWPDKWLYFASNEGLIDSGANIPGWKIEEWVHVNGDKETVRNLQYQRFYTVEQIAGASDMQIQRLGMGAAGLREAARRALQEKVKVGIADELALKDQKIAEQGRQLAGLSEQLEELKRIVMAQAGQSDRTLHVKGKSG